MIKTAAVQKFIVAFVFLALAFNSAEAGVLIVQSNGLRFTGADGVDFVGTSGMRFTGADGFLNTEANGMRFTGADGMRFTGADGARLTGADGAAFVGPNGARFTGADGMRFTGADGMRFTGADGMRFTGADGTSYQADSIIVSQPNNVSAVNPAAITLIGVDGLRFTGADAAAVAADGMRFTGADGLRFTGADSITGFNSNGAVFSLSAPGNFEIGGIKGAPLTGADISATQISGMRLIGTTGFSPIGALNDAENTAGGGLQSVDPQLALLLNQATDDSTLNAVVVFHRYPNQNDLDKLRQNGILGGTLFKRLPMIYVSATKNQIAAVSQMSNIRSIYGNRTLKLNSDPFYKTTQIQRVAADKDLQTKNVGLPFSGKNVTVAVLDTGINGSHSDLAGRIVQNVRLVDTQSVAAGFVNPAPVENLPNTDLVNGHGTFVAGVIAASGASSGGKYNGVAPGANLLGLSAGDLNLLSVLSGFDYLLDKGADYNVRVVNCSFSADTVFDFNDPVNVATKLLTSSNINVVFSAGNTGAGNGSLNPYAAAPWVVSVGATDEKGVLANFSSRGIFGDSQFAPSLVAPGVSVVSLRSIGTETGTLGLAESDAARLTPAEIPFYTTASGTSFSAPQVAGAIALMLEANPNLTAAQVKNILRRSATPLPNYYAHEVGAGMLNTYAAVLEAAFPNRKTGIFRAVLGGETVKYATSVTQTFGGSVGANDTYSTAVAIPANAVQSNVYIAWGGLGNINDLSLKLYDNSADLRGQSNVLNIADFGGRTERVTSNSPNSGIWQAVVQNSFGAGTNQNFLGAVETTQIQYGRIDDLANLAADNQTFALESLRKFLILPEGSRFMPAAFVTRAELAAAIVRAGKVPQFVAARQAFLDVRDLTARNAVESAQFNPNGRLFYDVGTSGAFRPYQTANRLTAAIAIIKASELETSAANAVLPANVADANSIPALWRGYAALALQKGWLKLDNNNFRPNSPVTRLELAKMLLK